MRTQRFHALVADGPGGRAIVVVPFDPDELWGAKAVHHVNGTVDSTRGRVTLYRGVYPVAYDVIERDRDALYFSIFRSLLDHKLVKEGDLIILTKGELTGVAGGTNSMQILQVVRK